MPLNVARGKNTRNGSPASFVVMDGWFTRTIGAVMLIVFISLRASDRFPGETLIQIK
jgi:hypothetical protein